MPDAEAAAVVILILLCLALGFALAGMTLKLEHPVALEAAAGCLVVIGLALIGFGLRLYR